MTDPTLPLFYKSPRPLVADRDAERSFRPGTYAFAAGANGVPLMAAEFSVTCKQVPILFTDSATAVPMALLGLRAGENLFVDATGAWEDGAYVPGYIRRYPFIFQESADKSQLTLCLDEAADSVVVGRDNPFFTDGQPTALTVNALAFVKDYQAQSAVTEAFMQAVIAADLLVGKRADVTLPGGERLSLDGFQVIDEARFNQLPGEEILRWWEHGWLGLVYAHLISLGTWASLIERQARRGSSTPRRGSP